MVAGIVLSTQRWGDCHHNTETASSCAYIYSIDLYYNNWHFLSLHFEHMELKMMLIYNAFIMIGITAMIGKRYDTDIIAIATVLLPEEQSTALQCALLFVHVHSLHLRSGPPPEK